MWSTGISRPSSAASNSHNDKSATAPSSFSHHRRAESARQGSGSGGANASSGTRGGEEDVWNLDDSDNEGEGINSSSIAGHDRIARVAAQAGLGRKASSSSLAPLPQRTASPAPAPSSIASPPSAAALHVAAALKGAPVPAGIPPQPPGKDRARQPSYGFWERLSGIGAAVGYGSSSSSGSGSREKERERDDVASSYASSGYARFDSELELEDNFDGTYSVNAPSSSSSNAAGTSAAGSSQNKLLAPASIATLGGARALSSGKVPTLASNNSKGKSKSMDSPSGPSNATIVGTPRARSPLGRRRSEIPRDEEEMREQIRSDVEDIIKGWPIWFHSRFAS